MTDLDLDALRARDELAFSELVRAHHHALIAVAVPLVGAAEAEEIVQNSWLKAYQAISDFEGRSQLRTWLTRIVINEARMKLRKRGRESLFSEYSEEFGSDGLADRFLADGHWDKPPARWDLNSPEELLIIEDLAECLEKLLNAMPPTQRAILEMRDTAELPFDEICNELSISASNARVTLHRARTQLFKLVDHFEETGEC